VLGRISLLGALCALVCAAPAGAVTGSLYSGPGPRPGPDILYEPPATAPQLTNSGIWHAAPILVSGASSYRDGEFLYQDFLYDDHGANGGVRDPGDRAPRGTPSPSRTAPTRIPRTRSTPATPPTSSSCA
jgi:hypothetical protein